MTGSGDSWTIIDEDGSLFGVVNIVDALVVLLVLAVVVAGVAAVVYNPPSDPGPETLYHATLSYTVPLESDATMIDAGDTLDPVPQGESLDVTGVARSFSQNGEASLIVKVAYRGGLSAQAVRADGILGGERPLYGGDRTEILTRSYRTRASVLAINQSASSIPTRRVDVVVSVNDTVAQSIESGDRARIGDETVATVLRLSDSSTPTERERVALEVVAWDRDGTPWFGGQALRIDNRITVVTNDTVVSGRLQRVGTANLSST